MIHADKWGPLGSIVTALCCLGAAPVVGALAALGLGFLLRDAILIPLLALFLAVTAWSLRGDRRRHGRAGPERLAWIAALLALGGLWISGAVVGVGLVSLVAASVWNWMIVRRARAARIA
ncbi:MAG: MerC family mercury resistance protein [Gemmatimonadota bacterium]